MFFLYRGITLLASALIPFYVLGVLARHPGRRRELAERLGLLPRDAVARARAGVWIHGASLGELQVARIVAADLARARPELPLALSVTTPTARRQLQVPGNEVAATFTFPLDLPPVVAAVVAALRPRLMVTVETELWPNLFAALRRRRTPVAIINGRISDAGLRRYRRIGRLIRRTLDAVTLVCARTEEDGRRFLELGLPENRLVVTGDLKFDRQPPREADVAPALATALRGSRVLVAASSHAGEEEVALAAARQAADHGAAPVRVVLAPRHLERLPEVERLLRAEGVVWRRRSALAGAALDPKAPLAAVLLDTHGELAGLLALANVALLGGTLAPVGGHNPLEAAAAGVPLVTGPHCSNVRDLVDALEATGGALRAADGAAAAAAASRLLLDPQERRRRGAAAGGVLSAHRGAAQRAVGHLVALLEKASAPA